MSGILNLLLGSAAGVIKDAYFNLVTLLLNTTATNGAQNNTFLDSSTNNFSITRNGNTTQGTFTPFSQTGWGNYFSGSGTYLNVTPTTAIQFAAGDFTIEFWINFTSVSSVQALVNYGYENVTTRSFLVYLNSDNTLHFAYSTTGSNNTDVSLGALNPPINTWMHIAVVRSGTTVTGYKDGVALSSPLSISTNTIYYPSTSGAFRIANDVSNQTLGYMSNVRLVKGTAVYTSAFTPPTSPLTAISGTSFLSCQSNRFVDNSASPMTVAIVGSPSVQAFSPFAPTTAYDTAVVGGSGYFDGTGDYLALATGPTIGTGAFCLEAWFYCTSTFTNQAIFGADGTNNRISILINNATTIAIDQYGVSGSTFTVSTMALNAWNHIAASRNGSSVATIFVNGVRSSTGTATLSNNYTTFGAIGRFASSDTRYPTGYIAGVRTTVGSTPYDPTQTTCTVPTAPPTAITNTQFLLNYTNAGIYDSTAKNDLETVGNAQVSTTQAKWGTTSIYFDGSGDYLFINSSANNILSIGTGDFTVEGWFNFSNISNNPCICSGYFDASNGWYFQYYSNNIELAVGSTALISKAATVSNGTWYHMAVTRAGGTLRAFLNGVQQGTSVTGSTTNLNVTSGFYVGILNSSFAPTTRTFAGYMNDLRITKGVARYTTNFTLPTAAFPLQ